MICTDFLSETCTNCKKECFEQVSNLQIKCEEHHRKYTLMNSKNNPLEIRKYHIDQGVIQGSETLKCDYAFYCKSKFIIFIELKGKDFNHALKQIINTVEQSKFALKKVNAYGRVIATRCPNMGNDPKTLRIREFFVRLGGNFISKSRELEEPVSDFL